MGDNNKPKKNLVQRFQRWVVAAIGVGALTFLGGSIWAGFDQMKEQIYGFTWWLAVPIILLTLLNYFLRFLKWHYLIGRLGANMPFWEDAWNFTAGLAMVISPGKAGEVLKPYVVRVRTGTPMARTIPALVTERLTDGISLMMLAGISVTTYAGDKVHYLTIPAILIAGGLAVLASKRVSLTVLGWMGKLPLMGRIVHKLEEMYLAMRVCVAPVPLLITVAMSFVAWAAECLGYYLVFQGLGVDAPMDICIFLYAFATIAGGAMPGGLGVSEGALAAGSLALIPALGEAEAVAAMLLVRIATLWLGVGLGAIALFKVSSSLGGLALPNEEDNGEAPTEATPA